jgi:hypothetical protein
MAQNRYSSPISASFYKDDTDSSTESDSSWGRPENQLGLERLGSRRDDEEVALDDEEVALDDKEVALDDKEVALDDKEVALDKKGEMNHHEGIAKY